MPPAIWLAPAALLVIAVIPLPYGYYTFLRITVCGVSAFLAYREVVAASGISIWAIFLGGIALLFNPLIPVHLTRYIWFFIDLACAVFLVGHFLARRKDLDASSGAG
jgi:hypothetical protein